MRPYEVMIIFDADLDEETIRSTVESSLTRLEGAGGQRGTSDYWGKRRFAYQINHRDEGFYVVLQARSEPSPMEDLSRALSLSDEVIRHKVLRIPEEAYGRAQPSAAAEN